MKFTRTNKLLDMDLDVLKNTNKVSVQKDTDKKESKTFLSKLINGIDKVAISLQEWQDAADKNYRDDEFKFWIDMKQKLLELVEDDFQMQKKYPGEYEEAKKFVRSLSENNENNEKNGERESFGNSK